MSDQEFKKASFKLNRESENQWRTRHTVDLVVNISIVLFVLFAVVSIYFEWVNNWSKFNG